MTTTLRDAIRAVLKQDKDGDMIVAQQPWSPMCVARVLSLGVNEVVVPKAIKAEGFAYFLEGDIARDLARSIPHGALRDDEITDMLIYYAQYDGFPDWANERIRTASNERPAG